MEKGEGVQREAVGAALQELRTHAEHKDDKATVRAMKRLCYRLFMPWENPSKVANAQYFAEQEGALALLVSFVDSETSSIPIIDGALSCLWNLASTVELARASCRHGTLEVVIEQLQSSNLDVVNSALGCLTSYLELDDVRGQAAELGIGKIFVGLLHRFETLNDDAEVEIFMNCVLTLMFHPKVRKQMASSEVVESVIKVMEAYSSAFPEVRYLCIGTLAFLALDSALATCDVLHIIGQYTDEMDPQAIAKESDECGTVWTFIRPFFELMSSTHATIRRLCGLIYASFALTSAHQDQFKREALVSELLAVRWSTGDARLAAYLDCALAAQGPALRGGVDAPSLVQLCAYRVRSAGLLGAAPPLAFGADPAEDDERRPTRRPPSDHHQLHQHRLVPQELQERFALTTPL